MARFVLREGSRGGERILGQGDEPGALLELRDQLRERHSRFSRRFDVIDTEATDPPESGEMDRCPDCGEPMLASFLDYPEKCPNNNGGER